MANLFKNPLVLAETVVGSMIDQRSVILWEQPAIDTQQVISATSGAMDGTDYLKELIDTFQLKELFVGTGVPKLSDINGFNAFGISYMGVKVSPTSDLCEHPVESGGVITDNAIINPLRATVEIVMPTAYYTRIYEQMQKLYKEKRKIILQTKFGFYQNMVLVAIPYAMNHKDIDRVPITLELQQVLEVYPTYISGGNAISNCLDQSDSDTKDLGTKTIETTYESLEAIGLI